MYFLYFGNDLYIFPLNIKAAKWHIDMAFPDDMV